jgi:hypothetical protein
MSTRLSIALRWGLVAALLLLGCAAVQKPKPVFKPGARVGIINGLEAHVTHSHATILRADSFDKTYEVDWDAPSRIETRLKEKLEKDGSYTVVPVQSPEALSRLDRLSRQIEYVATQKRVSKDLAAFVREVGEAHHLDVVIIVKSYKGESPWRIAQTYLVLEGYGLFTRKTVASLFGSKNFWVHPYAHFTVAVFGTNPVALIGSGVPRPKKSSIKDFGMPEDFKHIPAAQLNQIKPFIEKYADQSVDDALRDSHLVPVE